LERVFKTTKFQESIVKLKISKLINTYVTFSSSIMNFNVPTTVQEIYDMPNQQRGHPISLAIICNYVNKQLLITRHRKKNWIFLKKRERKKN